MQRVGRSLTVALSGVLPLCLFIAVQTAVAQRAAEPIGSAQRDLTVDDETLRVQRLRFQDAAKEYERRSTEEIIENLQKGAARNMEYYVVSSSRFSEAERLDALRALLRRIEQYDFRHWENADYLELTEALDACSNDYPDSVNVALQIALIYAIIQLDVQYARVAHDIVNSDLNKREVYEDARVRRIRTLVRALPTLRREIRDKKHDDPNAVVRAGSPEFRFYRELITALQRYEARAASTARLFVIGEYLYAFMDHAPSSTIFHQLRLQKLTPLEDDSEPVKYDNPDLNVVRLQDRLVDKDGNLVVFKTPETFEDAKNDGERVFALRKELFDAGSDVVKADVLASSALDALLFFGLYKVVPNARDSLGNSTPVLGVDLSQDEVSSLADDESYIMLSSGLRRVKLPQEYAYATLWRQAHEYAIKGAKEYFDADESTREALNYPNASEDIQKLLWQTRAAVVMDALIKQDFDRIIETDQRHEEFCQRYNLREDGIFKFVLPAQFLTSDVSLKQLIAPKIAFSQSNVDENRRSELEIAYRNANAVDVAVSRIDLAQGVTLKNLCAKMALKSYEPDVSLHSLICNQLSGKNELYRRPPNDYFQVEETTKFQVELDEAERDVERTATLKLGDLEPGVYLVEATAMKNGERGVADKATLWIPDLAVLRFDRRDGCVLRVFDPQTGKPVPNAKIDAYTIVQPDYDALRKRQAKQERKGRISTTPTPSVKAVQQTTQTDENGEAFVAVQRAGEEQFVRALFAVRSPDSERLNLASVVDVGGFEPPTAPHSPFGAPGCVFLTDRPLYQYGDVASFKCILDKELVATLNAREVSYCIFDSFNQPVVQKSGIPLDRFNSFTDSFEIPDQNPPLRLVSNFMIVVGDELCESVRPSEKDAPQVKSTDLRQVDVLPTDSKLFKNFLGGGTICARRRFKGGNNPINVVVTPLAESCKPGDVLSVKVDVTQSDGQPVEDATVSSTLEVRTSAPILRNRDEAVWDWYYRARQNNFFYTDRRVIALQDGERRQDGSFQIDVDSSLDAAFNPEEEISYALNVGVRIKDEGNVGFMCVVPGESSEDGKKSRDDANFEFQVVPSVVAPGQTATISVRTQRADGIALTRIVDYDGVELRPSEFTPIQNGVLELKVDVKENMTPFFTVEIYSVADGKLNCAKRTILAPPQDRFLKLDLEYDQALVKPGATVRAVVTAPTDQSGAFVDASLFASSYAANLISLETIDFREDPRKRMTLKRDASITELATNLASAFELIPTSDKLAPIAPKSSAPDESEASLTSARVPLVNAYVNAEALASTKPLNPYGVEPDAKSTPLESTWLNIDSVAASFSKLERELTQGQKVEWEISIPENGADVVAEVVVVDEQGRVGFVRKRIAPTR